MNKGILPAILLGSALFSGPALAAKNVANTTQKGSLLIYPAINVDPVDGTDTLIEISNDESLPVQIECYYINERKDRVDFDFTLTAKQTVSWDVGTGAGEISPPPFPGGGSYNPTPPYLPVDPNRGELVCFATDITVQNQIAFNHLIGTATIVNLGDSDADQGLQAFRYNAWAFAAEGSSAPPANGTKMGTAGKLVLSGAGTGTYDACPLYNIANFMPGENLGANSGATLGSVYTINNDLTIASCNQDLRQDFLLHLTKLQFTVWNANEQSFTGAYACVDSVNRVPFDPKEAGGNLVHAISNLTFPTLRTTNARFQVQGVQSTQCPASENAAMIGVLTSSLDLNGDHVEDAEVGSTTQGAGAQAGYVLWDPAGNSPTPQAPTHH